MANTSTQVDVIVDIEDELSSEEPKKYCVILHNDDVTSFECVIQILMIVFHKTSSQALELTNMVHFQGRGVAGVYTLEIAKEKTEEATQLASALGYPLKVTYEEH